MSNKRRRLLACLALLPLIPICFPIPFLWLLCTQLSSRGPGATSYGPALWLTTLTRSYAIFCPLLLFAVLPLARLLQVITTKTHSARFWLVGVVSSAIVLHSLMGLPMIVFGSHRIVATAASPDGQWQGSLHLTAWLDASYSLILERRPMAFRALHTGESSGAHVGGPTDCAIRWSPDGRYVSGWLAGFPICAIDTPTQREVNLSQHVLLFAPSDPAARAEMCDALIARGADPVDWLMSDTPAGCESWRLEVLAKISDPDKPGKWRTPLTAALFRRDPALVGALLRRGADPNHPESNGRPLLGL